MNAGKPVWKVVLFRLSGQRDKILTFATWNLSAAQGGQASRYRERWGGG